MGAEESAGRRGFWWWYNRIGWAVAAVLAVLGPITTPEHGVVAFFVMGIVGLFFWAAGAVIIWLLKFIGLLGVVGGGMAVQTAKDVNAAADSAFRELKNGK